MKNLPLAKRQAIAISWMRDEITMNDAARLFGLISNPRNVLSKIAAGLRDAHRAGIIKTRL